MRDREHHPARWPALHVAGVYLLLGVIWIAFSDRIVLALVDDPGLLTWIQTGKGWFFVLASAGVVYLLTRRALRQLAERERWERKLGLILDTIPTRVAWRDNGERYLGCNQGFALDAGLSSPRDIPGRTDKELPRPLNVDEMEAAIRRVIEGGKEVRDRECVTSSADDELRWLRYSVVPLPPAAGVETGVLLCYDDITEEVRARQQLRQAQKMNEIGQLTSGVAHDFNNVLSVIRANAELVAEEALNPEEARLAVTEIQAAAESAGQMVKKLLGLGRKADLEPVPVDVAALLAGLSSMFSRLLTPRYPYSLDVRGTPGKALVDPSTVEQALLNLVTNARDAMAGGGRIRVEVEEVALEADPSDPTRARSVPEFWTPPSPTPPRSGRYVAVSVSDEGTGIEPRHLESVFQPFYTTKAQESGTGLGLAMVQGLMEQQGGAVQVRSASDRGTTMRLLLPLAGAAPEDVAVGSDEEGHGSDGVPSPPNPPSDLASEARPRTGHRGEGPGGLILVVDDSETLRRTMGRVLRRYGWDVLEASDGREALGVVEDRGRELTLILSDITMPGMGGLELFRELRRREVPIPFAVTSGLAELREVAASPEEAGIPFIPKPWTPKDLAARIRDLA